MFDDYKLENGVIELLINRVGNNESKRIIMFNRFRDYGNIIISKY